MTQGDERDRAWLEGDDGKRTPHPDHRAPSGQFRKGYSGNPAGSPKGSISFRTRLRKQLRENPDVMADIIRRLLLDSELDSKVALQVAQWHDGDNPDAFDREQELQSQQESQSPRDVIGACIAALRGAGMHDMADKLQGGAGGSEQGTE